VRSAEPGAHTGRKDDHLSGHAGQVTCFRGYIFVRLVVIALHMSSNGEDLRGVVRLGLESHSVPHAESVTLKLSRQIGS
jgi:hypothetical protein